MVCFRSRLAKSISGVNSMVAGDVADRRRASMTRSSCAIYWVPSRHMKHALWFFSSLAFASLLLAQQGSAPRLTADLVKGLEVRNIGGIFYVGPGRGYRGRSEESQHLVHRDGVGRAVEDHQSRAEFPAGLRRSRVVFAGRGGGGPEEFGCGLAGHGREPGAARDRVRRRRLQEHGRRAHLEESRAAEFGACREDRNRSAELEYSVRGGAGAAVFAGRRPRRIQDHRRRRDVEGRF